MSYELLDKPLDTTVYKHRRTGRLYAVLLKAKLEMSGEEVVVYRSLKSGRIWVRPSIEFFDGRYLPTAMTVIADGVNSMVDSRSMSTA